VDEARDRPCSISEQAFIIACASPHSGAARKKGHAPGDFWCRQPDFGRSLSRVNRH
jgi:hypothetical protein